MWRQLKPPVRKKELEWLIRSQGTCLLSKFIVSYEPGAKIGRLIPNGFASCLYHDEMVAILEDGIVAKPTVSDPTILQKLEEMYQPFPLATAADCEQIQKYILELNENANDLVRWIPLKKFIHMYAGYIRNAERLPDPQRLEHTIYRKIKESVEVWASAVNRPVIPK